MPAVAKVQRFAIRNQPKGKLSRNAVRCRSAALINLRETGLIQKPASEAVDFSSLTLRWNSRPKRVPVYSAPDSHRGGLSGLKTVADQNGRGRLGFVKNAILQKHHLNRLQAGPIVGDG